MIFISHDIALLSEIADAILVMYAGEVCEHGSRDQVIDAQRRVGYKNTDAVVIS